MFYELMLPYINLRLSEFKFEQIYSILLSASRPLIKKRALCKGMIEMGIAALPLLKESFSKFPKENLEKMIFQYFRVIMNFVYKDEQKVLLEKSFQEMNVDVRAICVKYGYLIPQSHEIELKNDYEKEEDGEKKDEVKKDEA